MWNKLLLLKQNAIYEKQIILTCQEVTLSEYVDCTFHKSSFLEFLKC